MRTTFFPTSAAIFALFSVSLFLSIGSSAQITFQVTDVPSQAGQDSWKAWADTSGRGPGTLSGTTGGPHRWDFSWPKAAGETVQATSVVFSSDAGHGGSFPQAAFAERATDESDGCRSWSYFTLAPNKGRTSYGFHDGCKLPQPDIVFAAPAIDMPDKITFGQTWERELEWSDQLDAGIVLDLAIHFTSRTVVDAFGTVVLPLIGEVPALRLNEVNTYQTTELKSKSQR